MKFTIKSAEKLPIRGNLDIPRGARALVILIHGFKGFKDWGFFPWLAEVFFDTEFSVCRFNMSRSGIGENPDILDRLDLFADDTYSRQLDDLHRVIDYCQKKVALPTFLVGHSRGGSVAILAAEDIHNLRGIVTWSAMATVDRWDEMEKQRWREEGHMDVLNTRTKQVMRLSTRVLEDLETNRRRLDIGRAVSGLEVPLLAIHGGRDESVPVNEAMQLSGAGRDVSRLIIGGASHTYNAIHPLVHVPRELMLAADATARFIGAYS